MFNQMPGDTGMTYPFPYKTGDGEENVKISNLIVTGTTLVEGSMTIEGPTLIENNVHITEDLIVDGTINSDSHTSKHFIATDPTNQYRVSSGTQFDLVHTASVNPTFNLKNSVGSTGSSNLVTDRVTTRAITATTGAIETIDSNTINTNDLTATDATLTNITGTTASIDEIVSNDILIQQTTTPIMQMIPFENRGIIRTLDDAFGLDISVQGLNKQIKLATNDTIRLMIDDTNVTLPTETESTDENTGALIVKGGMGISGNVHIRDNWTFEQLRFSFNNADIELMTITPASMDILAGDLNVTVGTITCEAGQIRTTAGNIVAGRTLGLGGTVSGYIVDADNYVKINNISVKSGGGLNYDFILPNSMGSSGKALISNGSGSAMTWQQFINKITINVPSYLTVSGSPIDNVAEGTITIGGSTTGSGVLVLNNNPTLIGVTVTGSTTLTNCNVTGTLSVAGATTLASLTATSVNCGSFTSTSVNTGSLTSTSVTTGAITGTTCNLGTVTCGPLTSVNLTTGLVSCGNVTALNISCVGIETGEIVTALLQCPNITAGLIQAGNVTCLALVSTSLSTGNIACAAIESGVITAAGIIIPVGSITVVLGSILCEAGSISCPIGSVSTGALGSGVTLDNVGKVTCHNISCEAYLGIGGAINCSFFKCFATLLPPGSGTICAEGQLWTEATDNTTGIYTGALQSYGGLSVAKDVYIGLDLHLGDTLYGNGGILTVGDDVEINASLQNIENMKVLLGDGTVGQQLYNAVTDSIYHFFNCYYDGIDIKATSLETCAAFFKDQDYLSLVGTTVNIFTTHQTMLPLWKTNLNDGNTIFNETVNVNKTLTVGTTSGQSGIINVKGLTSGTVSIKVAATAGTFDFILPTTAGTAGQVLVSNGGASPMTWASSTAGAVTSVAMTVPAFLSVTGSPVTSTGTLAVSLSGTALPVLNGGTGTTTSTGTGSVVLSNTPTLVTPVLGVATGTSLVLSSYVSATELVSTITTGTAPITVTSTTVVPNLNVSQLLGSTWAIPGTIGSTTPSTGAFTTLTASGTITSSSTVTGTRLISTIATGTSPLGITSTTVVPNLNVSQLLGNTWAIPGTIGSTTPSTGAFTSLTATTGTFTNTFTNNINGTSNSLAANDTVYFGPSGFDNGFIDRNFAGGNFIWGYNTVKIATEHFIQQWYNNSSDRNLLMAVVSKGTSTGTDRIQLSCPLYSSVTTGTAPFSITSTTVVPNLNVSQLLGATWVSPGTIGSTTPSTGAFTTLTASSTITGSSTVTGTRLISTIATGTAPLGITSTTVVPNLNVSQLLGNTWAIPGTIGSTTPSTGAFTTLTASSTITGSSTVTGTRLISTIATGTAPLGITSTTVVPNLNVSQLLGATWASPGTIGSTTPSTGVFSTLTSNGNIVIGGNNALVLVGLSSGSVSIKPNTTGSSWDFILPSSAGTSGQVLVSGGGSTCTWTSTPTFTSPVLGTATATSITSTSISTTTLNGSGTTVNAGDSLLIGPSGFDNLFIDRNIAGGNFIWGYNTVRLTTEHFIQQWYNNSTDRSLLMAVVSKGSSSGTDRVQVQTPLRVTHNNTTLAQFYRSVSGPASIAVSTNATPSASIELCIANGNGEFSSNTVAGDAILRNITGGRILIQSGTSTSQLIVSSSGLSTNGIDSFTYSTGTFTPTFVSSGFSIAYAYTEQTGYYTIIGNVATVSINLLYEYSSNSGSGPTYIQLPSNLAIGSNKCASAMAELRNSNVTGLTNPIQLSLDASRYSSRGLDISSGNTFFTPQILGAAGQSLKFTITYPL